MLLHNTVRFSFFVNLLNLETCSKSRIFKDCLKAKFLKRLQIFATILYLSFLEDYKKHIYFNIIYHNNYANMSRNHYNPGLILAVGWRINV